MTDEDRTQAIAFCEFYKQVASGQVRMIGDENRPEFLWDLRWSGRVIRGIKSGDYIWCYIEGETSDIRPVTFGGAKLERIEAVPDFCYPHQAAELIDRDLALTVFDREHPERQLFM